MAEVKKSYLDLAGLAYYDGKIKTYINGEIQKVNDSLAGLDDIQNKANASYTAWTQFLAGWPTNPNTVAPTLTELALKVDVYTKTEIDQKLADNSTADQKYAKDYADGLAKNYATADQGALADSAVQGAEGETGDAALVTAEKTEGKNVKVSSTQKLQDAVALAESALQKSDIAEGSANGTISVDGSDVKVHGLGSAAFTDSTAYDVAGAAGDALNNAKTYTNEEIAKLNATTLKMSDATDASSISDEITSLKNSVSGGTFFRGVFNSKDEATDPKNGDVIVVGSLEYIYNGKTSEWIELGDSSANAQAISNLNTNKLDKTAQAADSAKLNGQDASYYATAQSVTDLSNAAVKSVEGGSSTYVTVTAGAKDVDGKVTLTVSDTIDNALNGKLGKDEKAADSAKLNGQDASYYATADALTNGLAGKTSMSVVSDGVVFTQGEITVSPITNSDIDALFA